MLRHRGHTYYVTSPLMGIWFVVLIDFVCNGNADEKHLIIYHVESMLNSMDSTHKRSDFAEQEIDKYSL